MWLWVVVGGKWTAANFELYKLERKKLANREVNEKAREREWKMKDFKIVF